MTAAPFAVFDLDGTLSDTRHRMHRIAGGRRDWDRFFAAAGDDGLHAQGRDLVLGAVDSGATVVYLSGRPRRLETVTRDWLTAHGLPNGELLLRGDTDRRPATAFKLAALRGLARRAPVAVLLDDDPAVIAAVRRARLPGDPSRPLVTQVLLATWQPRDAATHAAQQREGRT